VQRAIHAGLLQHVPVHEAAHGFVAQRSVATHAAAHAGQAVVIKFDLRDFFGSIRAAQVAAAWRTLGYPAGVARCLAALCTHRTARMVVDRLREDGGLDWLGAKRLRAAHLPQGAPTSPTLSNLCAFGLDLRLDGLAWAFGATYTRYADDLVFSGGEALRHQFRALRPGWRRSRTTKVLRCTPTKRTACRRTASNASPAWWSTPTPTRPGKTTTA
jgi:hypothetical protein